MVQGVTGMIPWDLELVPRVVGMDPMRFKDEPVGCRDGSVGCRVGPKATQGRVHGL